MAKPIEPTPILKGEDVTEFYRQMEKEAKSPNPRRLELIRTSQDVYNKIIRKF